MKKINFIKKVLGTPSLLLFGLVLVVIYAPKSVSAVALQRGIYIQNPTSTSMDIAWKTDTGGDSVVKYGTAATYGQQLTGDVGKKTIDGAPGFLHHVKITGLNPNTTYYYQVLTQGTGLSPAGDQSYMFKTSPADSSPFTFAIWGDSGTGDSNQTSVATQVQNKKPAFAIIAGDIDYGGSGYGSDVSATTEGSQDARYFDIYKNTMKSATFFPVCGNHDGNNISTPNGTLTGCKIIDGEHYLPGGGKMGGTDTTFSWDYGNVHFTAINSNQNVTFNSASPASSAPQMAWAYNDIKNSTKPWKILVLHHNSWSSGSHSTLTNVRDNVAVMAQMAGANVMLWGHSHVYERFSRYSAAQGPGKGPYYFTIGNGGKSGGVSACGSYSGGPNCVAASGQGSIPSGSGFLFVQVNNTAMTFNYVGSNGTTYDTVTYNLSEFGPVPTDIPISVTVTPSVTGTVTPPTATPTGSFGSCSLKSEGDADCNGSINLSDFEILRKEINGILSTKTADFNNDGIVNVTDFEIFRKGFYTHSGGSPTSQPTMQPTISTAQILPGPTNLQASCPAPGTSATLTWSPLTGAQSYWLLIDDLSNTWSNLCQDNIPGDYCTPASSNSHTFTSVAGHTYRWGVQGFNGKYGTFILGPQFTCATNTTTPTSPPLSPTLTTGPTSPPVTPVPGSGIWLSQTEISALRADSQAWNEMKAAADGSGGTANLANQDSGHPQWTLAVAFVGAKLNSDTYKRKAVDAIVSIMGTENNSDPDCSDASGGARSLSLGRNLAAYVIAADTINFKVGGYDPVGKASQFKTWLSGIRNRNNCEGRTLISCHAERPNNWGTMCGASRIASDLYLSDQSDLQKAVSVFKGYLGDRSAHSSFNFQPNALTWMCDSNNPRPVNPVGCAKNGHDLSGAPVDDVQRGGGYTWPPNVTNYAWGGFSAAVAQAEMLKRAGYDSYAWESQAILRAMNFISTNMSTSSSNPTNWLTYIVNKRYNTNFATSSMGSGRLLDWTAWTHPR